MHFCRKCDNKLQGKSKRCNVCGSEIEKLHKENTSNIKRLVIKN